MPEAWTAICFAGSAALVSLSYRKLSALRALSRWAAPQLDQRREARASKGMAERERRIWVAELNEATIDIRAQLERPGFVPQGCAKAAFSLGAAVALMQAIRSMHSESAWGWIAPILSIAGGALGALGCWFIGRSAEAEANRLRTDWNALIRRSTRDVAG
jgi:hypothetical protein